MDSSKKDQSHSGQDTTVASVKPAGGKPAATDRPKPASAQAVTHKPAQAVDSAAAKGGDVKPVKSTLLGENGDYPAALPKSAETPGMTDTATPNPVALPKAGSAASLNLTMSGKPTPDGTTAEKPVSDKPVSGAPGSGATASARSAPPRPTPMVIRKTGFVPVFLGGVVAAGLGAAVMYYALPQLPARFQPGGAAEPPAIDTQAITRQAVDAAREAGAESGARAGAEAAKGAIAALPAAEPVTSQGTHGGVATAKAGDASLAGSMLGPVELVGIRENIAQLQSRVARLTERPGLDPQKLTRIEEMSQRAQDTEAKLTAAAEAARKDIAKAQEQARKLSDIIMANSRAAKREAAVARLQTALIAGGDRSDALDELEAAGIDTPTALSGDVPSLASLQGSFDDAARAGLRAALQDASQSSGAFGAVVNFLRAQTGARSITPRDGDDVDAVLSRAGAAVDKGQIGAALDEIAALPDYARQAMQGWLERARAYANAQAVLTDLSASAK